MFHELRRQAVRYFAKKVDQLENRGGKIVMNENFGDRKISKSFNLSVTSVESLNALKTFQSM